MLKLLEVLSRWKSGLLSQLEAAELLGKSEWTFRRSTGRFGQEGEEGLVDQRPGRRWGRAVPEDEAAEVERLYRERYAGFTAELPRASGSRSRRPLGYTWTKNCLQGWACW